MPIVWLVRVPTAVLTDNVWKASANVIKVTWVNVVTSKAAPTIAITMVYATLMIKGTVSASAA